MVAPSLSQAVISAASIPNAVAISISGATSPFSFVTVTLEEVVAPRVLEGLTTILLDATSYRSLPQSAVSAALLQALIQPLTMTFNLSSSVIDIPICSKIITTTCVTTLVQYSISVSLFNETGDQVGDAIKPIPFTPVDVLAVAPVISVTTLEDSINMTWVDANTDVEGYAIRVFFDVEGNSPDLPKYNASKFLPNELLVNATLSNTSTSYTITGCFPTDTGGTHCIYPWTVYQVVMNSIDELRDIATSLLAVTQEGRQRAVAGPNDYSPVRNPTTFVIRTYLPRPWAGQPLNFTAYWTGQYNQSGSFNAPFSNSTLQHLELTSIGSCVDLTTLRIFNLIPYSQITVYFASINRAGVALQYSGPVVAYTAESFANTPNPPVLTVDTNTSTLVVVTWSQPVPPYGIIIRYQLSVGYSPFSPFSNYSIIYDSKNTTITYALFDPSVITSADVRVRAYTSVGAGPWSDAAVDKRPTIDTPAASNKGAERDTLIGTLVPLSFILVVVVLILIFRKPRIVVENFSFPVPDAWEMDRKRLTIEHMIGEGISGKVHRAILHFLVENHAGKFKRGEQGSVQLNLRRLCGFAADIANGMAFLSKKKWVHRGRVCIMTERFN